MVIITAANKDIRVPANKDMRIPQVHQVYSREAPVARSDDISHLM